MVNNPQYNKNYYLTICIFISLGSGTKSVVLRDITSRKQTSNTFIFSLFYRNLL